MPLQLPKQSASGLQHYDDVLQLTGRQYRLTADGVTIGVVLGRLDARTGWLPIGLVDPRNAYWAETLYYDANRRRIDVYDLDRWTAFVGTYAGGGWLLDLVTGLGRFTLMVIGGSMSALMRGFAVAFLPAMLFGVFGLFLYGFFGYVLYLWAMQWLPHLIGGILAWIGLCAVIALERRARCQRIGRTLEVLIEHQLMPVFV
ncbi:hypothetical protein GOFOIKOB_5202 [Methylobacterium tardum]|uniref:Uncharacterized protein n=1 Tax=Methylobacterium tardum TaxID=374432 RepID=A0AA37WT16_9HYPH|nr:hypothetical protein [Methylobacterium tardum]GJE52134.1 hypothetical protein GOFOIKOB_5202 [Methylobacterium tardum]GLS71696.1 hypothetical protein GCM10007890_37090 [Methylobacterium tardum]